MKVVHIESGLGNQMLDYCELLALRHVQPEENIYIETIIFDIPECNEIYCQWNGYELEKVFGIQEKNIKECFSEEQWDNILSYIRNSKFWSKNWNWPVYFCEAFRSEGLYLSNTRGDFEKKKHPSQFHLNLKQTYLYNYIRRVYKHLRPAKYLKSDAVNLFYRGQDDALFGQRLTFQRRNNRIELIDEDIRQAFSFPSFSDEKNIFFSNYIQSCNSVAIHVRRGDMLSKSDKYYRTGYFIRAVKYIKAQVPDPVFIFFCDPGSKDYCIQNLKLFYLQETDKIKFVDWNYNEMSYRDMQLMALCKHNIVTNSSFGWWGAYLNNNKNKITISPEIEINTTHHL